MRKNKTILCILWVGGALFTRGFPKGAADSVPIVLSFAYTDTAPHKATVMPSFKMPEIEIT